MQRNIVAIVQLCSSSNVQSNVEKIEGFVAQASQRGALMVFLPENFNYLGKLGTGKNFAQSLDGEYLSQYKLMAQNYNVWLSLGGFQLEIDNSDRYYNSHIIIDSNGQIVANYNKLHMFDIDLDDSIRESSMTQPGLEILPPVQTIVGKIGLSICYDLRFPEMYRLMALQGAQILTVPAAFLVKTGMAHWEPLLRARAIENQCYIIASAQVGEHDCGRSSYGRSMIVDPWGTVIAMIGDNEGIALGEIDLNYLDEVRRKIPSLKNRRDDIY